MYKGSRSVISVLWYYIGDGYSWDSWVWNYRLMVGGDLPWSLMTLFCRLKSRPRLLYVLLFLMIPVQFSLVGGASSRVLGFYLVKLVFVSVIDINDNYVYYCVYYCSLYKVGTQVLHEFLLLLRVSRTTFLRTLGRVKLLTFYFPPFGS